MEKFFHLKENGTTVSTEILAGLTTFFAMAYIIVVNPQILSQTGIDVYKRQHIDRITSVARPPATSRKETNRTWRRNRPIALDLPANDFNSAPKRVRNASVNITTTSR